MLFLISYCEFLLYLTTLKYISHVLISSFQQVLTLFPIFLIFLLFYSAIILQAIQNLMKKNQISYLMLLLMYLMLIKFLKHFSYLENPWKNLFVKSILILIDLLDQLNFLAFYQELLKLLLYSDFFKVFYNEHLN